MNLKVLKNKNLVLVVLGQFVSGFGTFMQSFALSLYVLQKTGSAALFSSVIAMSIIPRIVLTPIAGVIADRFSRKKNDSHYGYAKFTFSGHILHSFYSDR